MLNILVQIQFSNISKQNNTSFLGRAGGDGCSGGGGGGRRRDDGGGSGGGGEGR